jgi:hypothetical protein
MASVLCFQLKCPRRTGCELADFVTDCDADAGDTGSRQRIASVLRVSFKSSVCPPDAHVQSLELFRKTWIQPQHVARDLYAAEQGIDELLAALGEINCYDDRKRLADRRRWFKAALAHI